jgi:F-type H+-transporting ATPase subunit a
MSHVGFAYVLAIFTFVIFHAIGIRRQGLGKYLKGIAFLPGVPKFAYILLTPIEIATYFIIRPVTLSLRLFANMFAGHLLLLVFIGGGNYMLHDSHLFMKILSPFSFGFGIVMTFFEFMVQCLQAYIITLLSALFIAGALVEEH